MNNFNNPNGMHGKQNPFNNLPPALRPKKTNTALKFLLVIILGIIPLLLCSKFIGLDPSDISSAVIASDFKQWGETGMNAANYVSYGIMWLIGISIYIATIIIVVLLTKFVEDINLDVLPLMSGISLAMLNMFVIPHSNVWFLLLSIPSFMLVGYIIGGSVSISIAMSMMQKEMNNMSDDQNNVFKQMQEQMRSQNPNMKTKTNPNKKVKYKDNPFVDVKEDKDEEDNEHDNKNND